MPGEVYMFPTSFAQRRLWFLDQMVPGNPFYNLSTAVRLYFPVNIPIFKKSLNEIVRRHETLRTTFTAVDGKPYQVIASSMEIDLPFHDLTHLKGEAQELSVQELLNIDARAPFELSIGPLARATLIKLAHSEFAFLLSMHHIISDGWCRYVFFRELNVLYESFLWVRPSPLPELPIQYADYAVWQLEYLQGKVLEEHMEYWKQKLADLSPLMLPLDKPRPVFQSFHGSMVIVELSKSLSDDVRKISVQENITVFMTLLAAFIALLHRYCNQDDIVVGVPVAGRNHTETENLIGFFVNSIIIRTDLSSDPTFLQLLQQVKASSLEAFAHQDLPFEKLVEELHPERDFSRNPLFQVTFQFMQFPSLPGDDIDKGSAFWGVDKGTAIFDLCLSFAEQNEVIRGEIEYSTDLFEEATIQRMAGHFQALLTEAMENPGARVSQISYLSEEEKDQLLIGWNDTARQYTTRLSLNMLIEKQVQQSPTEIAVIFKDRFLSYDELNKQSNCLARYLRSFGIKEESYVGVCLERSEKMIVTFLGILKAGAAYIPLDPSYPKDRLEMIAHVSGIDALISERNVSNNNITTEFPIIYLDEQWPQIVKENDTNLNLVIDPLHLAYIIYTSGSTGSPKGVMVSHAAVCNHMLWMISTFSLTSAHLILQRTPYSFDASIWEFYVPLMTGARLYIAEEECNKDPDYIIKKIISECITIIQVVPSMLKALLNHPQIDRCTSLQKVYCGGEPLPAQLISLFYDSLHAALYNLYGPTEATIDATYCHCSVEFNKERVPIGRPIFNTQLYVLDKYLNPVSIGIPGELWIGGDGLARGYLENPALTAEKFLPDPFGKKTGGRIYRTGDMVRYRPNGNLEYIQRTDQQIKLRGYRIEPGEIENTLKKHPSVKDCVVVDHIDENTNEKLIAFIVIDYVNIVDTVKMKGLGAANANHWPTAFDEKFYTSMLTGFLMEKLPYYMIPAAFIMLDKIPLKPNGKVDRLGLPKFEMKNMELNGNYLPPENDLEEMLAGIWSQVLHNDRIGINDHFFKDLGGHSLLATQLISRVRDRFRIELTLQSIFKAPTIKKFAEALSELLPKEPKFVEY